LPQVLEKRPPSCDRQQQDLGENFAPSFFAQSALLNRRPPLKHKHRRVFQEVHPALIALPAVVLGMLAGRAGKAGRCVAPRTKLIGVRIFMAAFGASHDGPLLFSAISIGEDKQELEASIALSNFDGSKRLET
jgi:hypothetical protein